MDFFLNLLSEVINNVEKSFWSTILYYFIFLFVYSIFSLPGLIVFVAIAGYLTGRKVYISKTNYFKIPDIIEVTLINKSRVKFKPYNFSKLPHKLDCKIDQNIRDIFVDNEFYK